MASRSSWLASLMTRLSGSGNCTLRRIWCGMTIPKSLSNTGVETSSKPSHGWCGSQPMPSIWFTPLSIAVTSLAHQNTTIPNCTLRTGGGRLRSEGIHEDDEVLTDINSTLRVGNALVPLIFMSDGSHILNTTGDKNEWPVYMTISYLSLKISQMPSTHSIVLVTLMPIPIKNRNISQTRLEKQRHTNREVLNEVLQQVFQRLSIKQIPSAESQYYNVLFADGNFRHWKLVFAASLADGHEYSDLHLLKWHVSVWCECPKNDLGDYVPPDMQHLRRDDNLYRTLSNTNPTAADAEQSSHHIHQ